MTQHDFKKLLLHVMNRCKCCYLWDFLEKKVGIPIRCPRMFYKKTRKYSPCSHGPNVKNVFAY